jgi:hypothetical protein
LDHDLAVGAGLGSVFERVARSLEREDAMDNRLGLLRFQE